LQAIGKTGGSTAVCRSGRGCGRGCICRLAPGANFIDQSINFPQENVDIFSKGLFVFDVLQFSSEKINSLEQQVEQLRTQALRHHIHGLIPDNGKEVLRTVGDGHEGVVLHHGGRTLDGVHDPKNGVDIVLRKAVLLFGGQDKAVQLLKQGVGFV